MAKINEHDNLDLQNAYNRITTVWNSGTDDQQALAGQIMDDITKLIKFRKRYNTENFNRKRDLLIDAAKKLFMEYAAYRRGDDSPEIITLKSAPENNDVSDRPDRRGGKREGAGRKPAMENPVVRKVSITLPKEKWDEIDQMIEVAEIKSLSNYFRLIVAPEIKIGG